MITGFVKLDRAIKDSWLWQDPMKFYWYADILMEVNIVDKQVLVQGTLIDCKKGQCVYSLDTWSKRWRIDKSATRRFLLLLEKSGYIKLEDVRKTTRLTILESISYDEERNADETQTKRRRNADETQTTPTKERKKEREKEKNTAPFESDKLNAAWREWIQYLAEKKKTPTAATEKRHINTLKSMSEAQALDAIETSISAGWSAVFVPKINGNHYNSHPKKGEIFL